MREKGSNYIKMVKMMMISDALCEFVILCSSWGFINLKLCNKTRVPIKNIGTR
jgi:hypothetical protein